MRSVWKIVLCLYVAVCSSNLMFSIYQGYADGPFAALLLIVVSIALLVAPHLASVNFIAAYFFSLVLVAHSIYIVADVFVYYDAYSEFDSLIPVMLYSSLYVFLSAIVFLVSYLRMSVKNNGIVSIVDFKVVLIPFCLNFALVLFEENMSDWIYFFTFMLNVACLSFVLFRNARSRYCVV